jgi:hypothetical protein
LSLEQEQQRRHGQDYVNVSLLIQRLKLDQMWLKELKSSTVRDEHRDVSRYLTITTDSSKMRDLHTKIYAGAYGVTSTGFSSGVYPSPSGFSTRQAGVVAQNFMQLLADALGSRIATDLRSLLQVICSLFFSHFDRLR